MKAATVTLRVPASWQGRVGSACVRNWLAEYFQRPHPLAEDPGGGDAFLRLSLPRRAVKVFAAAVDNSTSAALRRLIASRLALPTARPYRTLPEKEPEMALASSGSRSLRPVKVMDTEPVKVKAQAGVSSAVGSTFSWAEFDRLDYWVAQVRAGYPLAVVPADVRPYVARWVPNAPCGTLTLAQTMNAEAIGACSPAGWRWIVWLGFVALLLWLLKPWRWLERGEAPGLPTAAKPALRQAFTEWVPKG